MEFTLPEDMGIIDEPESQPEEINPDTEKLSTDDQTSEDSEDE